MLDRFTKVVLTIIAAALICLCLWGPGPNWGAPAEAALGVTDINIAQLGGKPIKIAYPERFEGTGAVRGLPVEIKR